MERIEIENKHILTRQELHDLMISYNSKNKLNEEKLSKAIYELIDGTYSYNVENIEITMYFREHKLLLFELSNGNYIYWIEDNSKSEEDNYTNKVEFLECLLSNYKDDLSGYDLNRLLNQAKSDLKFVRKNSEIAEEISKDPIVRLKQSFKSYDYVKILKNYRSIGYYDVITCKEYFEKSEDNQNDFNLTVDEKVCLCFIILYGLKNIYFYSSKLYKYSLVEYDDCIKNINVYLDFIEKNKDNVSNKEIHDKENDYYTYIILKNVINQFYLKQDEEIYIIREYIKGQFLREPIQLIYFEYLINNKKYEEARKYITESPIYLYSYFDNYLNIIDKYKESDKEISVDEIVSEVSESFIKDVVEDYKMNKYDTTFCEATINDILSDNDYKNYFVIPVLPFIINYIYLLKAENREEQVNCLYSFLKIFEKGFGIENFFMKFEYELLVSKLTKLKNEKFLNRDDDNVDVDNIIEEIAKNIDKANLVDKHDIDKVETMYPYINFKNLNYKVKEYIATGDTIMLIFDDKNNIDFDYSSAVIEWCKAVELEAWEKLTNILQKIDKNYRENICNQINPYKYIKRQGKKNLAPNEVVNFKFGTNIGTFDAIDIRFMNDGRTMRQFLFDEYYSKFYEWNLEKYNDLIDNILKIYGTRNNSAHKDNSINFKDAKNCQSIILSAKKILEILSKLEKKK